MTDREILEQIAFDEGISVDYLDFKSDRLCGLYVDGSIALRSGMDSTKTADVLAEELGHYYTATGDILDQTNIANRKQERAGRLWAYNNRIGLTGIIAGYKARCQNRYELAKHLNVSEEFLQEAIDCYKSKYGTHITVDNYVVIFEPSLSVVEKL